jgi:peptidoglycan L-alanyl-D-glutamate endopeptidase CwlK
MSSDNPALSPTVRDNERLLGVHPRLVSAIRTILSQMFALGHPMFVVEGLRTDDRQKLLYEQGRSRPGAIVTNVNGLTVRSHHQVHPDGFAYAVDCAFVPTPTAGDPYSDKHPWLEYGSRVERLGLQWGGRWRQYDAPHAELDDRSHVSPTPLKA